MDVKIVSTGWLLVLDAVIGIVSLPFAYWFCLGQPVLVWPPASAVPTDVANSFGPYMVPTLIAPFTLVCAAVCCGLYRQRGPEPGIGDAVAVLKAATLATLILIGFCTMYRGGLRYLGVQYSRAVYLFDWACVLVAMTGIRLAWWAIRLWPDAPKGARLAG